MKKLNPIIALFILIPLKSMAGVAVSPVQLFIENPAKKKSVTMLLESKDDNERRVFEVQAFKWVQDENGENELKEDNQLIVNPKNFILEANKQQAIRIGIPQSLSAEFSKNEEKTWRIIVNEITPVVEAAEMKFLVKFNLPLFIGKQEELKIKPIVKDEKITLSNVGKSHIQVVGFKLLDQQKKEVYSDTKMAYILPEKTITYSLKNLKNSNLKNYTVVVETTNSKNLIELKLND